MATTPRSYTSYPQLPSYTPDPCLPSQELPAILHKEILPTLHSRHSQLMSEFAFWPSSPPHKQGGIFEMRSYELVPGTLLEWETAWKRGLEARKRFVVSRLFARGV